MYLENGGCHLRFPAIFFYTGIKHSLKSVNCSGRGKKIKEFKFSVTSQGNYPKRKGQTGSLHFDP